MILIRMKLSESCAQNTHLQQRELSVLGWGKAAMTSHV
jgi:hypothetical protein